jgi:hypothetical protein
VGRERAEHVRDGRRAGRSSRRGGGPRRRSGRAGRS